MPGKEHAERLLANLMELGPRRLMALGLIGCLVLALVGFGAWYFGRPQTETLYTGLQRDDVGRIGQTLNDNGIPFDVSPAGDAVLVPPSQTSRARMVLAERGLPQSPGAGYELFDHLGSLGLTSFMQEVTRVRALEGEIARTIQSMKGIRAARVHLVMPDSGSFRRDALPASASVVIRAESADGTQEAGAIRHLVASAVPGMTVQRVTVLSSDGTVLMAGDDPATAQGGQALTLERTVANEAESNIRRTLTPYLGLDNFEVSATAKLNTDRKQINETTFDPNSRVERSVRTVKENQNDQNTSQKRPTTVTQNIPEQQTASSSGEQSSSENQRREDLTNYELSSKTVQTVSDGYVLEHLSIAVTVNRQQIMDMIGKGATEDAVNARIEQIKAMAISAAGVNTARGDRIEVAAVDFAAMPNAMAPIPPVSFYELVLRQSGTLINAATILVVATMLIWFGLKPAVNSILQSGKAEEAVLAELMEQRQQEVALQSAAEAAGGAAQLGADDADVNLIEDLSSRMAKSPLKRLEQIVQFNEEQAANILKQWLHAEEA